MTRRRPQPNDIFDPRNWEPHPAHAVIWLDPQNNVYCILDHEDYTFFHKWRWTITFNKNKKKIYATRNTRKRGRSGPQTKLFLHKEILERCPTQTHPKLIQQIVGDHINGAAICVGLHLKRII